VAWKRAGADEERARAGAAAAALGGGTIEVGLPVPVEGLEAHVLVVVRKTGRTGPGWPRDPAARQRRPW